MTVFNIPLQTFAETSIDFEPDEETLAAYEESGGDIMVIINAFWESEAAERTPTICAQCSGWGSDTNLVIGDEWEISEWQGVPSILKDGQEIPRD